MFLLLLLACPPEADVNEVADVAEIGLFCGDDGRPHIRRTHATEPAHLTYWSPVPPNIVILEAEMPTSECWEVTVLSHTCDDNRISRAYVGLKEIPKNVVPDCASEE
jgi:hypothetical protein